MQLRADFYYATRGVFASLFDTTLFDKIEPSVSASADESESAFEVELDDEGSHSTLFQTGGSGASAGTEFERGSLPLSVADRTLSVDRASCERVVRATADGVDEMLIVIKDGSVFCFDQQTELRRQRERERERKRESESESEGESESEKEEESVAMRDGEAAANGSVSAEQSEAGIGSSANRESEAAPEKTEAEMEEEKRREMKRRWRHS
jgi:hypothetical protein